MNTPVSESNTATASRLGRMLLRPYGRPVHPLLAWTAAACWLSVPAFDALSRISETEFVYARGAYVLTGLGLGAAVIASLTGLADLVDVDRASAAYRTGLRHLLAMDAALVLVTVSFLIRRSSDFAFHEPSPTAGTVFSILALVAVGIGLWNAARLVYVHEVG